MKLKREEIQSNPYRKKIYRFIMKNPGVQFNQIVKTLDMNISLVEWHLNILLKFNFIKKEKLDHHDAYFHLDIEPEHYKILHLISREKCKEIVEYLKINNIGITRNRLSEELNMHPNTIKRYIKKLEKNRLLHLKKLPNKTLYFLDEKKYDHFKNVLSNHNSEIFQTASFPLPKKDYSIKLGKNGNRTWNVYVYEGEALISNQIFTKLSLRNVQWFILQSLNHPFMNPNKLKYILKLAIYCALNEITEPITRMTPKIKDKIKTQEKVKVEGLSFQEQKKLFRKYWLNRNIIPYIFPIFFSIGILGSIFEIGLKSGYSEFPNLIFFFIFLFILIYFLPFFLISLVSLRYSTMFPKGLIDKLKLNLKQNLDIIYDYYYKGYSKYLYFISLIIPLPFSMCFFISDFYQLFSFLFLNTLIATLIGTFITITITRKYTEEDLNLYSKIFKQKKTKQYLFIIVILFSAITSLFLISILFANKSLNFVYLRILLNYLCFVSWFFFILLISRQAPSKNHFKKKKSPYSSKEVLSLYRDSLTKVKNEGVKRTYLRREIPLTLKELKIYEKNKVIADQVFDKYKTQKQVNFYDLFDEFLQLIPTISEADLKDILRVYAKKRLLYFHIKKID
jgi:DNA-binding MarR family transcriptional regulator